MVLSGEVVKVFVLSMKADTFHFSSIINLQ